MIQVQIASQITAQGLCGVRWVLVEAVELVEAVAGAPPQPLGLAGQPETAAAAVAGPPRTAATPALAPSVTTPMADSLRLTLLKALVVALGLGAALWTAAVQVGPPGRLGTGMAPQRQPNPQPQPQPQLQLHPAGQEPALPVAPAEPADPTEPAASAPLGGLPRLTARL